MFTRRLPITDTRISHLSFVRITTIGFLVVALGACGNASPSSDAPRSAPPLEFELSAAPIDLTDISAQYAENVRYGPAERNLFDIYIPDCAAPTPLLIYIHGGGFGGGDKQASVDADAIRDSLRACVAHAAINYTLLDVPGPGESLESAASQGGVLSSLRAAARALQFMRYHFESFNLDPEAIALYGESAGAGISLWLGTHDDLADPQNADPVLRESTRVKAVGALSTQATLDMIAWGPILQPVTERYDDLFGGTDVLTITAALDVTNYLLTFLGVARVEDLFSSAGEEYRADVDMLALMDAGDAPIFVHNFTASIDIPLNLFLHHGLHALAVKNRADEVGLHSVAYVDDPEFDLQDPSGEDLHSFLMRHIR